MELARSTVYTGKKRRSMILGLRQSKYLLILLVPCLIYFILFQYLPMWGVLVALKNYKPYLGFAESEWVGFKYFVLFFSSPDIFQIIRNTFLVGVYCILWGFPFPLIFALLLNEVKSTRMKKLVQTVSYMPHFLSTVIIVGMIQLLLSPSFGIVNQLIQNMGGDKINFLQNAAYFRSIYVASEIWKDMGWSAILYIAALTKIDTCLYESAMIDGANRLQRMWHITLAGIAPTIITLLLLRMGSIVSIGFEKVYLLQNPSIYSTSDVIQTYVYRQGLALGNFSYGTAVGLFNSVINLVFLILSNFLAKRYSETSLW